MSVLASLRKYGPVLPAQEVDGYRNRAGCHRQELMQRPRREAADWLASLGLLSPPYYKTQDSQPRDDITYHGLGSPAFDH